MTDLYARFEAAKAASTELTQRPDNMTLLKLYSLYKQGSQGDASEPRPGFSDIVARAKWDAWSALRGTSKDDAMQRYVDLMDSLE